MRLIKFSTPDPTPRVGLLDGEEIIPLAPGPDRPAILHADDVRGKIRQSRPAPPPSTCLSRASRPSTSRKSGGRASPTSGARWPGRRSRSRPALPSLRPGLPGRPARAVLQGDPEPRRRPRTADPGPGRHPHGASPSRSWPWSISPASRVGRLHDRQRRQRPRHRGREPALPAPGQGLRRLLPPRARPSPWPSDAAPRPDRHPTSRSSGNGDAAVPGERPPRRGWSRDFEELIDWLGRDNRFPDGAILLTGTGIVPPDEFSLRPGDRVRIAIDGIGTLVNPVVQGEPSRA